MYLACQRPFRLSASGRNKLYPSIYPLKQQFSHQLNIPPTINEAGVILAVEAIKNNPKLSIQAAAKIYNVADRTIRRRLASQSARCDYTVNSKKLTQLEEEAIVRYIIELSERAFPPRPCSVEDMANHLLRERDAPPVGKLWVHRFVNRHLELRMRRTRKYDY